jgi:hypothetical protein
MKTQREVKTLDSVSTLPRQKLKAERVQDALAAASPVDGDGFVLPLYPGGVRGRLKAERVQQALKAMPGWRLASGAKAIDRAKAFPNAEAARLYSGFVAACAGALALPVVTSTAGRQVIVTLHAPRSHGRVGPLTESVLELARLLG